MVGSQNPNSEYAYRTGRNGLCRLRILCGISHIQDTFAISRNGIYRRKEKRGRDTEMVRETVIAHWLAVFGAPGILVVGEDMGFNGEIFQDFAHRVT